MNIKDFNKQMKDLLDGKITTISEKEKDMLNKKAKLSNSVKELKAQLSKAQMRSLERNIKTIHEVLSFMPIVETFWDEFSEDIISKKLDTVDREKLESLRAVIIGFAMTLIHRCIYTKQLKINKKKRK